ncbi:S8 family peptidase [bacterium]|nr:S8 family peptidase [bacterium]
MRRRAKVLSSSECPDIYDLPLSADYIKTLEDMGAIIIVRSRWLNAVSVRISKEKITDISDLYFVKSVQPVHRHHIQIPLPLPDLMKYSHQQQDSHTLEYGGSFSQLDQINVPETHDLGLSGEGVFIGMIDSGFDTEGYRIFSQTKIMNTYDFYWDDENPANEIGDSTTQHNHGTMTLSVIGGYQEGVLIGSAYGASYALAKSEWISSETQLEEDLWVAALEWMEGLGVDIVSSSLGYGYFDNGFSYSYEDLNGDVCVTTVAADIAAKKGVTVLTSAGNEAMDSWHYILSPADGDSVIAVGAVDWNGEIASFSSGGPTSDGRIKPDVVAMGMGIYSAKPDPDGSIHYVYGSGTSFSCPLAAGVCALILEAHPELTPMQVRNALRETADRADIPDNQYGWGLVDAYQAVFYHGPFLSDLHFSHDLMTSSFQLEFKIQAAKQVSESSVRFYYTPDGSELQTLSVATIVSGLSGQYSVSMPFMPDLDQFAFYVSLNDCEERIYTIPKGAPDILYQFSAEGKERIPVRLRLPESYALLQNFPNPFNNTTKIVFRLPEAENVEIHIFNITGQRIDLLLKEFLPAGEHSIVWYGYDDDGLPVPSGLYLCLLTTREYNETRKMILAR